MSIICILLMCLLLVIIGFLIFLLLGFKDSLYILDNSTLSDVAFINIFSHSVACLTLLTLSYRAEVLNFNEVQLGDQLFLPWMMSLVLNLRSHHHTQGRLSFPCATFWGFYKFAFYT